MPPTLQVYDIASKAGPDVEPRYAVQHARQKYKQRDLFAAAAAVAEHGCSSDMSAFELYRKIALDILGATASEKDAQAEHILREMMYRYAAGGTAFAVLFLQIWHIISTALSRSCELRRCVLSVCCE